mgnify:CR=1 FL=1
MYVCMYVCVCVCMYACMDVGTYAHIHTYIHTYICSYIRSYIHILIHTYTQGVEFDDEALQRIMKESGPPPSQLIFPSFFQAAHKVMKRLQQIQRMNISFRHIVIHSSRYGVRRDGVFLVVKSPVGVAIGGGKLSSQLV